MIERLSLPLLLSSMLWIAPTTTVHAQDAAAAAFAEGERAAAEYDYIAALEHFEEAFRLRPHDAVRFNMAVCLESLGRFREAWLQYRAAMQSEQLDDDARADARTSAERLRARLAFLHVTSSTGAEVRVDDDPRCAAPCETEVDPGPHEIAAIAPDGRRADQHVELARGETLELTLELPAPIAVDTRPASGIGWLSITGGVLAAVGVGGTIGFGVHTVALADAYAQYERGAPQWLYDDGVLMQQLTNVSIAVLAFGAALIVLDVVLAASGRGTALARSEPGVVRF